MAKIRISDSKQEAEISIVDKHTFEEEIGKLKKDIAEIRIRINPAAMKEYKKLGKESVDIKKLKGEKQKTPIEELMGE